LLSARPSETVHVIGQLWEGAEREIETHAEGRLVIHRVPYQDWSARAGRRPHPAMTGTVPRALFASDLPGQAFSWQASMLAERLVQEGAIDVIEAEDYEAPLYFFLLRRALGLGPEREPPCFIHLHSPTQLIARHNGRDIGLPEVVAAKRLEDYCIAAADALLCPSAYLARQAEVEYGLPAGSVHVIPLPAGDTPELARDDSVWSTGSLVYLGRLERRKGVVEWLEAAIRLARERPDLHFDFVGANVLDATRSSGAAVIERLVPADVRRRFRFHGHRDRAGMLEILRGARIAVVPSRWENFPNSCVETMSSGLPVLATRAGGMVEMIEDGVSGWLTSSSGVEALEAGLRRALGTSPTRLAEMGVEAARRIREVCDNERTTDRHVGFRESVFERGAGRSLKIPVNLPWAGSPLGEPRSSPTAEPEGEGVAVVTTHSARNEAVARIREKGTRPLAYVFMTDADRLDPDFARRCNDIFRRCPEVGLIGTWTRDPEPRTPPCPAFPYQWLANDVSGPFAVRAAAFEDAGGFGADLAGGLEVWDLVNAVMASGRVAVNVPQILSHRVPVEEVAPSLYATMDSSARRRLLSRFPELVARDATDLVLMLESDKTRSVRQAVRLIGAELDALGKDGWSDHALPTRIAGRLASFASRALARVLFRVSGSEK
jgi:glycosyltransferase involved in cell wall biosynthesis